MVEQVRKIKIFVASPSDVTAERAYVQEAIDEINRTRGRKQGFVLELLTWEHNVHPGMGRPQALINKQIGHYDVFIGIMWKRSVNDN